jgi:hypothetical protein
MRAARIERLAALNCVLVEDAIVTVFIHGLQSNAHARHALLERICELALGVRRLRVPPTFMRSNQCRSLTGMPRSQRCRLLRAPVNRSAFR